jgi:hypothetical protein
MGKSVTPTSFSTEQRLLSTCLSVGDRMGIGVKERAVYKGVEPDGEVVQFLECPDARKTASPSELLQVRDSGIPRFSN